MPRALDVVLAAIGIVVSLPILAGAALAVRVSSAGPILFRQHRVGRLGIQFTLFKFRTMRVNQGTLGVTAHGDPRITPVGRWLRRFKVDELPEMWNVLRGDMAFVGPRPEVPAYVDLGDPLWRGALRARPGLTDPVTLRLRNEEQLIARAPGDPEQFYLRTLQPYKLAGYAQYIDHRSFAGDLGILLRTAVAVVRPSSVHEPSPEEVQVTADAARRGR
jgi:lipopolysaccharide/colanic/teichoic acid biosynthesis glycosyltransferase